MKVKQCGPPNGNLFVSSLPSEFEGLARGERGGVYFGRWHDNLECDVSQYNIEVTGVVGVVVSIPESSSAAKGSWVDSQASSDDECCMELSEKAFFDGLTPTSRPSEKTEIKNSKLIKGNKTARIKVLF